MAESRLSQIQTRWTVFFQAHGDAADDTHAARQQLLKLYGEPVQRYLRAALRDDDAAGELFQEFALKFVRGDFHAARPDRGRFRDFLKATLRNLIVDHHRRLQKLPAPLGHEPPAAEDKTQSGADAEFLRGWREKLLSQALEALAAQEHGAPLAAVLLARIENPDATAGELAALLRPQFGSALNGAWIRKRLHYARKRFATLLVDLVGSTLGERSSEAVAEELIELDLYQHCRDALHRQVERG